MSSEQRARAARNVIVAAMECRRDPMVDLATQAAQALEDAGLLGSPEAVESDAGPEPKSYPAALPWARLMDREDLAGFLDELGASAIANVDLRAALGEVEATCGRWRAIAEAQHAHNTAPGPDASVPAAEGLPLGGGSDV